MRKSGFTLIELLVVVAIVAVLIGILLPALANAREQAKLTVCANRLRQMGAVTLIYADENAGFWPPLNITYNPNSLEGPRPNWRWLLAKAYGLTYENDYPDFFHCPSSRYNDLADWRYWCSYGGNGHLDTPIEPPIWTFRTTESVPYPVETMMFVDITTHEGWQAMNLWLADRELLVALWHSGRCNVVYCDGHVAWQDYVIQNQQLYRR